MGKKAEKTVRTVEIAYKKMSCLLNIITNTSDLIKQPSLTLNESKERIKKECFKMGLSGDLMTIFITYLPPMYKKIKEADINSSEANLTLKMVVRYEIWTEGKHLIVDNIDDYASKKNTYLFWIDLTNNEHLCCGETPKKKLGHSAVTILKILTEHLGIQIPLKEIYALLKNETINEDDDISHTNNLQQFLTQLHNFSGKQFRYTYLTKVFNEMICLKSNFSDKYFIFETHRAADKITLE